MLIDTDVLIWYMRGDPKAKTAIMSAGEFSTSIITYMELVSGMRNKQELDELRKTFHAWGTKTVLISEEISAKASFFIEQHFLSHAIDIADALIGATAVELGMPLLTANDKHYRPMKGLEVRKFKP